MNSTLPAMPQLPHGNSAWTEGVLSTDANLFAALPPEVGGCS